MATQLEQVAANADRMSEELLQTCVLDLAARLGWLAYHTHDSRHSHAGFPDLVLARGRRVIFRELKTQKGKLRPEQRNWLVSLDAAGDYAIWRPADWLNGSILADLRDDRRDVRG